MNYIYSKHWYTCIHTYIHTYARMHALTHTYIHTYLLLLISMLWHRQAIFKSKGDKLCSLLMQDLNPGSQTPNRQQTECSLTNRLSYRGSSKNLNSTDRPYDQRAFSPLDPTVSWLSHLALAIYIFVVVNFDALVQASDIQIERRQPASQPTNNCDQYHNQPPIHLQRMVGLYVHCLHVTLPCWSHYLSLMVSFASDNNKAYTRHMNSIEDNTTSIKADIKHW